MQKKLGYFLLLIVFLSGCEGGRPAQSKAMLEESFECAEGAQVEYSAWSKDGWSKSCKMKHGRFSVWRGNTKVFDGFYEFGVKEGDWKYYDENGNTIKIVEFKSGREVKVTKVGDDADG